jgi:spore germination protein KC
MVRYLRLGLVLILSGCLTTGCWDRKELTDRAFDIGAGADITKDGGYLISGQFIVPFKIESSSPSGQSGGKTSYFVETGKGETALMAIQNMQRKLSRMITRSHRRNYYIGEKLAQKGITTLLDSFSRDPGSRIRLDFWVVKGDTALNALKVNYPLEKISSNATLKIHEAIGGIVGFSFLEYVMNASTIGSSPTFPAIELVKGGNGEITYQFYGRAIFNDKDQLVGYLNPVESAYRLWFLGKLKFVSILVQMSEYQKETVGVGLMKFKQKIHSTLLPDNKIRIDMKLTSIGRIVENNSKLDLNQPKNLKLIEDALNKQTSKDALQLITKIQKDCQTDIFGFNEIINRQHPKQWDKIKAQWKSIFPKVEVHVQVAISLKQVGLTGPSLMYKESEVEK